MTADDFADCGHALILAPMRGCKGAYCSQHCRWWFEGDLPMDTETTCHCGTEYKGADHCPECFCEQYETYGC